MVAGHFKDQSQSGFTLVEIIISIGILCFVTLALIRAAGVGYQNLRGIEKSSDYDGVFQLELAPLRVVDYQRFLEVVNGVFLTNGDCLKTAGGTSKDAILLSWRNWRPKESYCIDVVKVEEKLERSVVDVKFRAVFRKRLEDDTTKDDERFLVLRRSR